MFNKLGTDKNSIYLNDIKILKAKGRITVNKDTIMPTKWIFEYIISSLFFFLINFSYAKNNIRLMIEDKLNAANGENAPLFIYKEYFVVNKKLQI